ncbi:MAG: peptidase C13 [Alphaproteobacteria bacterium]|nr:peptidase C13 [Alphaproteobacteria bacterium]
MRGSTRLARWTVGALAIVTATALAAQAWRAPEHKAAWPGLLSGKDLREASASLDLGPDLERGRTPAFELAEHRRLDAALAGVAPQRPGVVDAYVVSVALDSDPVFGREAREAGKVLARRFDAAGRTIVLAGTDGGGPSALPMGSLHALSLALARIAERMDAREDVLVLYVTSHGAPIGISYHDGDEGYGFLSPNRLAAVLASLGIRNRLLILSACYSGTFVPPLADARTALVTAAARDRTSFGCAADNDWTFFGDAMINRALRKPQPLADASAEAVAQIAQWEQAKRYEPSNPQVSIGAQVSAWLLPLETRMPKTATAPVGRPAAR